MKSQPCGFPFVGPIWVVILLCSPTLYANDHENLKAYFGLLHAHTSFSDGSGTPEEAYEQAKRTGLSFFAVTPHNHAAAESGAKERRDGLLIATNHDLYNAPNPLTVQRRWSEHGTEKTENVTVLSVIAAAQKVTTADFVALYGQEFSTISSGNHVNVIDYDNVLTVKNGDFKALYDLLSETSNSEAPVVVQLNHPDVHGDLFYGGSDPGIKKKMFNDYGIDDYGGDFAALVSASDQLVTLIEMLTGPALSRTARPYRPLENDYYFYLVQGLHVSPTAGQDNHYKTWGVITDARTGVYCASLSKIELQQALRANRTFATEDKNLELRLTLNESVFMGDAVNLEADSPLTFVVDMRDADESNQSYTATLCHGNVDPQPLATVRNWKARDGELEEGERQGNGEITFTGLVSSGGPEFFYARVQQGDRDRAWTAPIWLNHGRQGREAEIYYWTASRRSKVYHKAGCTAISQISDRNLRSGTGPPEGRRLHNCVIRTEQSH